MKINGVDFDPEIFRELVATEAPTNTTALIDSGAVLPTPIVTVQAIASSPTVSIPLFNNPAESLDEDIVLGTDGTTETLTSRTQRAVAMSFTHGWAEQDFVRQVTNTNPLMVVSRMLGEWEKRRKQDRLLQVLAGIFAATPTTDAAEWGLHTLDISSATAGTVVAANTLSASALLDLKAQAFGDLDRGDIIICNSMQAKALKKNAGDAITYTNIAPSGVEFPFNLTYVGNNLLVEYDGLPVAGAGIDKKYTAYVLGVNSILTTSPSNVWGMGSNVDTQPYEVERKASADTNAGKTSLYARVRTTLHPNGWSYIGTAAIENLPKASLAVGANWDIAMKPRNIRIARIITNAL